MPINFDSDTNQVNITVPSPTTVTVTKPADISLTVTEKGIKGDKGDQGEQGIQGIQGLPGLDGADGQGVPIGGADGQFLVKVSATDYDTEWDYVESVYIEIENNEGSTLIAGTPLYAKGVNGNRILVGKADANDSTKMPAIGVLLNETLDGGFDHAISAGLFNKTITGFTGVSVGNTVYVSNTGTLTITKPTASTDLIQNIGVVLQTNGSNIQKMKVSAIDRTNDIPNLASGKFFIGGTAGQVSTYTLPTADGTTGQLLQTDGAGTVSFVSFSGSPWTTSGSDIYYNTGNVGIGTATPTAKLDVEGNVRFLLGGQSPTYALNITGVGSNTHSISGGNSLTIGHSIINHAGSQNLATGGVNKYIGVGGTVTGGSNSRFYVKGTTSDDTAKALNVFDSSDVELFVVRNDGNVGIGTATPSYPLHVNGNIKTTGSLFYGSSGLHQLAETTNKGIFIGQSTSANLANGGVVIGNNAGRFNSGLYNVAVGGSAGYMGSYSSHQIAIGKDSNSGASAYDKSSSIGIGADSNYNGSTNTTSVGRNTGANSPSSYTNSAFFGYQAGHSGGNNSVFVGYEAGKSDGVQTVDNTVAVGYQALTALTTGAQNTAVGYQAGATLTTTSNNTFIGYQAAATVQTNTTGCVAIGRDALNSSTTYKAETVAVGTSAGNWSGQSNAWVGSQAGQFNKGNQSVGIGRRALYGDQYGSVSSNYSVGVGYWAGQHSYGDYNVLLGAEAGEGVFQQSTFSNTVAVGYQALTALTTGPGNTAVGYQAADSITTAQWNTAIGYQAGASNITGNTNTFVGYQAGLSTVDFSNTYIGSQSGQYAVSAGSTGVGNRANYNADGFYNTGVGHYANDQVGAGEHNSSLGAFANFYNSGSYNVAVGYEALMGVVSTTSNSGTVAVGYRALKALTTGAGNTAVGYQASDAMTVSAYTTALGYQALSAINDITTGADGSTAVGYLALSSLTNATGNTAVGYRAGVSVTGIYNTIVGHSVGQNLTTGTKNVIIGHNGAGNGLVGGGHNVVIGYQAKNGGLNSVEGLTAIGSAAGNSGSTQSTHIGYLAGLNNSGTFSTTLGASAGRQGTKDSIVAIGANANSDAGGSFSVAIGKDATAGTDTVTVGYDAGSNSTDSVFIGYQAGNQETNNNRLYIENSNSTTPLIYGEFDNDILRVNGTLQVNDPASTGYAFPAATGTLGQVLEVDANGDLIFATPSGGGGGGLGTADQTLTGDRLIDTNGYNLAIELDPTGTADTFTIHDGTHDLFQVDTSTTGTLFSVNDVSGLPMFQSNSDGTMALPQILTAAPTGTAPEGTMQLGIVSGTCYLYVYINGGWKSTTLT